VDLIALGLKESDFTNANFTLVIVDYSDMYSGSITSLEVELTHIIIPLGYQFMATIPQANTDVDVLFYITLMDSLWNAVNTSIYQYHADGLPPEITTEVIESPLDLSGSQYIPVSAIVQDTGGVFGADVYYRLSESTEWLVLAMILINETTGYYSVDIPIFADSGNLTYYIRAFDLAGHSNITDIFTIEFVNGYAPLIIVQEIISPINLDKERIIRIYVNITDDGIIKNVNIYYMFSETAKWKIKVMSFDNTEQLYYFDVTVPTRKGSLYFKIQATDNLNLTSETEIYTLNFENAAINPLTIAIPIISLGAIGTIVVSILAKKKGGFWKLFTRQG